MLTNQFIVLNDNGVETELSKTLNDFRVGSNVVALVAAEDAIYIGSDLPFNTRYIKVSAVNDVVSNMKMYLWSGVDWNEVAVLNDYTSLAGATLGQSGRIEIIPNRLKTWARQQDSEDVDGISDDMAGLYDLYWAKILVSADLNPLTAISYIGHKFTEDGTLFDFFPDLKNSSLMEAFETGKTNWDEQHFAAAEAIIKDLRTSSVIKSANQILKYSTFETASVYKTAEIIYQGLGNSFRDDRDDARKLYIDAMKMNFFDVDLNNNAVLEEQEKESSMRFMTR